MIGPKTLDLQRPLALMRQCPNYLPTSIKRLNSPHGTRLFVKDESNRFNLGAFKALGGIYAMAVILLERWQEEKHTNIEPEHLFKEEIRSWSRQFTFVCASAGNHGIAVAMGAKLFNAECRIHLSEAVPNAFEKRLLALNVTVVRSGANYEEAMNAAINDCTDGEVLLSDSAWQDYTYVPTLVMEGYTVIAEEMRVFFQNENLWPTHVFLQAGVGGLAAAITYHIRSIWHQQPTIIVVEPDAAACLMESHQRGTLTEVKGPISSMGRLDCKLPSTLAFDILHRQSDHFVCVSDLAAERAVEYLATHQLRTTPSGAAGVAAVLGAAVQNPEIPDNAICLALVTEAET